MNIGRPEKGEKELSIGRSRGGEGRPFPYFKTKLSPEGLKIFFFEAGPPSISGCGWPGLPVI